MIYEAASHTLGRLSDIGVGILIAFGGCFFFTLLCMFEEKRKSKP